VVMILATRETNFPISSGEKGPMGWEVTEAQTERIRRKEKADKVENLTWSGRNWCTGFFSDATVDARKERKDKESGFR